jgi:TctA family transporter
MSGGSLDILFRSPASTAFILIAFTIVLVPIVLAIVRKVRKVKKNSILKVIAE